MTITKTFTQVLTDRDVLGLAGQIEALRRALLLDRGRPSDAALVPLGNLAVLAAQIRRYAAEDADLSSMVVWNTCPLHGHYIARFLPDVGPVMDCQDCAFAHPGKPMTDRSSVFFQSDLTMAAGDAAQALADHGLTPDQVEALATEFEEAGRRYFQRLRDAEQVERMYR